MSSRLVLVCQVLVVLLWLKRFGKARLQKTSLTRASFGTYSKIFSPVRALSMTIFMIGPERKTVENGTETKDPKSVGNKA
jgi:hypothetical protein